MSETRIPIKDILGKSITNIFCEFGTYDEWLATASCTIELDGQFYIGFPFPGSDSTWETEKPVNAHCLFDHLSDHVIYHVNKEGKSIREIAEAYQERKKNPFNRLKEIFLFGKEYPKEYTPYKTEYQENRLRYLQHARIKDFLWQENGDNGFFELDNGYLITETTMSPKGTGLAGLNYWENMEALQAYYDNKFIRLSEIE